MATASSFPLVKEDAVAMFQLFSKTWQLRLLLLGEMVAMFYGVILAYYTFNAAMDETSTFAVLHWPLKPFILFSTLGLLTMALAAFFQFCHSIIDRVQQKDFIGILCITGIFILTAAMPFLYKYSGLGLSTLAVGSIGFLLVFVFLMLRIPLGMTMGFVGIIGLFALMRTTTAVGVTVGMVPFRQCSEFIFLALPMFMLMGQMISLAGLSDDLFDCAQKWFGRLPGGLAVAAVAGCAGFGAVSGDSMATCATMTAVALPPMQEKGYDLSLATGALAAGGTLGILIPPSSGFIVFSIMTEVSVGKLFTAGILPGILLTLIFMAIVMIQVKRKPSLAPKGEHISLKEKLISLKGIIPVALLFCVVVGGIMNGTFSPGEGGAIGALLSLLIAIYRGRVTIKGLYQNILKATTMVGNIFVLLVGVFIFGVFLTTSHLPMLLSEFVLSLNTSPYLILTIVLVFYILLGFVMSVQPMMMLTLPAIFPMITALGFDGVWFGVVTVIVMEMGLITPPIGLNVFTLSAVAPTIPLTTIFKGVMPFFFGMCLCVLLLILFPQIALVLL